MVAARLPNLDPGAFILRTDTHSVALSAARAGLGIAAVHRPLADADPCLRAVLPDIDLAKFETWIVTHAGPVTSIGPTGRLARSRPISGRRFRNA